MGTLGHFAMFTNHRRQNNLSLVMVNYLSQKILRCVQSNVCDFKVTKKKQKLSGLNQRIKKHIISLWCVISDHVRIHTSQKQTASYRDKSLEALREKCVCVFMIFFFFGFYMIIFNVIFDFRFYTFFSSKPLKSRDKHNVFQKKNQIKTKQEFWR